MTSHPGLTREYFEALGRFTFSWPYAETGLDLCGLVIFQGFGGKTIENELPRSLGRKIKYLTKAFKTLPLLFPFSDEALPLMAHLSALKETRHDLIHGIHYGSVFGSEQNVTRIQLTPDNAYGMHKLIETDKIIALTQETLELGKAFIALSLKLSDSISARDSKDQSTSKLDP
jgi:hypothetical protein